MKQTVLISGICGFLGNRLQELLSEEFQIIGIDITAFTDSNIKVFSSNDLQHITIQPTYLILCHAAISSGTHSEEIDLLFKVNVKLTEDVDRQHKVDISVT
jgi:nucleoside-diphosphate-sugar epimerase